MAERKTWAEREQLVLEAVLDIEEQVLAGEIDNQRGMLPDTPAVVAALVKRLSDLEITATVERLINSGYLTGKAMKSMQRAPDYWALALTEKARVRVGVWPGDVDPVAALVEALAAREEQEKDPRLKGIWRRWREDAEGLPGHATKEFLTMLLKAGPTLLS